MHFPPSFTALLLAVPLVCGLAGCGLRSSAPVTAQAETETPAPKVAATPPPPGEAERIGAAGDEFNYRLTEWSEQGYFRDIITASRLRLGKDPAHIGARYALAHGLYYNGEFAEAAAQAQELVKSPQYQNDARANELLSDAQALSRRYAGQTIAPVSWQQNDVDAVYDKWRGYGAALIAAEKYDEIERTAAGLTSKPEITADGSWTLGAFFVGLWSGDDTEAGWQAAHARVEKWVVARPNSQLAQTCLARSWTSGAWIARGDKFANQISDETWKIVEERQQKAAPILRKMLSASAKIALPIVYGSAQRYGRLGGAPRDWQDKVFERGIAQFPGYTDLYRERAALLLPRWNGAPGEWEAEAARVADAQQDKAAGAALYARIVWAQWSYHKNMRKQANVDWPRTKRGFDAILQKHPGSLAAATIYLRLCHQWGDYAKAREILSIIAGRADADAWRNPAHFAQTRNFILKAP